MANWLPGLKSKRSTPGPKLYETAVRTLPFSGMTEKEKLQFLALRLRTADRELRIRRHTTWYLMALYYQGYQQTEISADGSTFEVFERPDFYIENQFRKHVDTVVQMLSKLEGDVIVRPGSDAPTDIATARVADSVLSLMRDNVGYEALQHMKNLYKVLFGNAFIFTDYIVDKKYGTLVQPTFDYQEMPGIPDETGLTSDPIMSKIATGFKKRPKGQEIAVVCSPLEINCKSDTKGGLENTTWLQWISRQEAELVNYVYPGLNIETGLSTVEQDLASQYLEVLGNLPGNILGDSLAFNRGSSQRSKVELVRTWLEPCEFQGDKALESAFPDGVQITTVNGQVVDYYNESLRDRWTHEVLIPTPHSMLGDGLYDALMMQDQINEINSLLIEHMRYTTVGHKVYDATIIDPKDIVNSPKNGWIPGRPSMDKNIGQSAIDLAPNALSHDVPAWLSAVKSAMQDMSSAYDPATGKGLGANTPYSQSVFLNERAQSRWQGSLAFNRPELIKFHRQLLTIAKDNWVDTRTRAVMNNTGQWSFEQFQQADLSGDVDIILSNTDMKPRTRAEQIQALTTLTTLMPIVGMLPPRQKLRIEEMLGLPPDANPMNSQISRAYRHIDRIKKGETVTPLPMIDDPAAQAPVIKDYLVGEDGEALALSDPQTFANIYTFFITLLQMQASMMANPIAAASHQMVHGAPGANNGQSPKANPGEQPGIPGGQPQGGPGAAQQPSAQSPGQPAPPVAPPSPS